MKKVKKIVIYAVIVAAVIACAVVVKGKLSASKKNTNVAVASSKTSVEVITVKLAEKTTGDQYKATLEAYQQGIITSKTSAKIVSISVENGQYINAGDTIATLDDQDIQNSIKSAQAQIAVYEKQVQSAEQSLNSTQIAIEKYKITMDDAQRNYDRQKTLFDSKAISQTDLELAEKTLNSAKADYNSGNASIQTAQASIETAKANLEAQKVSLEKYQSDLDNMVIKAPISGVISDKNMNIGQMVTSGSTLAKINDISSIYAAIQVPQDKISSIKIGQSAKVTIDGNGTTYDGAVQNIDLSADTSSRVFNCKIKIDNSDKSLLPGIFANVNIISDEKTEVITVPINALVGSEGNYSIFINDNGKAEKQKITIGETDENNVEIVSGLQDGDQVICTNTSTLQDGDEIDAIYKQDNDTKDAVSEDAGDTNEAVSE